MIPSPPENTPAPHPSPWAIAAGLVALGLLFYVSGGGWLIPLFALALNGVFFTTVRLESDSYLRWMIRVALIALVYQVSQGTSENGQYTSLAIGSATLRSIFGQVYAAEMVVQAWRRRDAGGYQTTLSVTLFSALVYLTACNVFDDRVIMLTTPVYMLCVAFALRDWRARTAPQSLAADTATAPARRLTTLATAQRVGAIVLTLGVGFAAAQLVTVSKDRINDLGSRLLQDGRLFENLGMSSQPELGSAFGLRGGVNRVLRVKNLVDDGHLRGATFADYDRGRWGPRLDRSSFSVPNSESLSPVRPLYGTETARSQDDMTITRLANMRLLFAPTNTTGLTTGDDIDTRNRVEWSPESGGVMRSNAPTPYEYIATVATETIAYQGPLCQPVLATDAAARARYLRVPSVLSPDGKPDADAVFLRDLARRITKNAPTAPRKIAAITGYLLANHDYSLTFRMGSGDPVAFFLREKKAAHCEFFAASASLLLRHAGVPSRYVTGYLAHEPGTEPGDTIVRQRDAHAWCEAWVDGTGWVSVDATPGGGRPDEMPQEKISPFKRIEEWFQDVFQKAKDRLADIPPAVLNTIVVASALLPLGLYTAFAALKAKRLRAVAAETDFAYTFSDETLAALSARYERAFTKAGRPLAPSLTYIEQFAPVSSDDLAEAGRQFAHVYDRARFGGRRDREMLATLTGLVEQIEQSANAATKRKR